jgi:predicted ATPase/signal transduction histidine kinase
MPEASVPIIPDYQILEKLGESPQAVVYKAFHKAAPQRAVVLKILKTSYLSEQQKQHFRQKIEQLKLLFDPLLIRCTIFEEQAGTYFIVRSYFEGTALNEWATSRKSLKDILTVSCFLAEALNKVHEAGIIHGSIKPHNILIQPRSLEVRLIDYITTLDVSEVSHFIYDRLFLEGTLTYTSPEQTGRINHRVDVTSDLYSLGIVFYELLTGKPPFFSLDPLELIHSHLAEEAAEVSRLNPEVPQVWSKIITRLLVKQSEKRYQSAAGLLADLVQCRNEYSQKGTIAEFPLGRYDYTHRVIFISKMVGRQTEVKLVLDKYGRAAQGAFVSLFISGLPGIGKTRLIQELQKPIIEHQGYFTSGKFDFYQRNIPYSALIQSLRNLMQRFLTESDQRIRYWKSKMLQALGNNGRILTEVIPELEMLVGVQPEVPELPPVESRIRFHYTFDRFLTCLATEENPLTLFIDDLQWCDTATLDFLRHVLGNYKEHKYLFFIGAYRNNEVDNRHPLAKLISNFRQSPAPPGEINLKPLEPQYCHEQVSYILDSPLSQTQELSAFISRLTEGNPLFASEILSYLHTKDLLFLDAGRHWQWDLNKIRESDMPPTVVELFRSKVEKLPPESLELLEYCACMGNRFSPTEISLVKKISLEDTFRVLKSALAQGLLMEKQDDLQFVHDRVQEAVLNAIPPDKRRRIHWIIGTHLLSAVPDAALLGKVENLFAITAHLNLGRPGNLDAGTAARLSEVNYYAGNKALDALATEAANEYFRLARKLLPKACWETAYQKTFNIFRKSAKTELMCGQYAVSENLLDQLLENAQTDMDKAECLAEQTCSLSSIGNFIKAIETANRGLAYFGKSIPDDPRAAEQKRELLMQEIESENIDVESTILNMPFTRERKSKIELAFYSEMIPDLYMSGMVPQLYLSAVQSTRHCLSGGMDESVIYSFTIMGLYLGDKGEFDKAFKYEDLARNLCEKYPDTFGATRGMNGIVWVNMHSRNHPEEIADYCRKAIQCGKNSGDLYNAGLSYGPLMWNSQVQGDDFGKIEEYAEECLEFSRKYHLYFSVHLAEAMLAGWVEPMKKESASTPMDAKLKQWEKDNHVSSAGSYYVHKGLAHYYFGEYVQAEDYLQGVKRYLAGLTDNVLKRQWHVFLALNALRLHEKKVKYRERDKLLSYLAPLVKRIETWAGLGPLLRPYLALLYAERERILGSAQQARGLYLEALTLARRYRYTFLEGYLNECLGELAAPGPGSHKIADQHDGHAGKDAGGFFKTAIQLYQKCRADRKMLLLTKKYPEYAGREWPAAVPAGSEPGYTLPNIDVNYLIKSCLFIPAETDEETLLHRIMNVVLESSGAQLGYLIMEENNELVIRAESRVAEKNRVRTVKEKFEASRNICHAIVRYVYRTREMVLLENALEEGGFKDNPEAQSMQLKSVLCLPVIKQNKLIGILYLENRLSDAVFTAERTGLTKLFTYEAAIALENARLVEKMKQTEAALQQHRDHLEEIVEKRTRQLHETRKDLMVAEHLAILGQLSGSISHEIRNPLNVINSSAYYLKIKLGKEDEKVQKHIARIQAEVQNSNAIIDSLLSLSGIKSPYKARWDLIRILDDAVEALELPDRIQLARHYPGKEIFIEADKEQLNMIFTNILKNAEEAIKDQGRITLQVDREGEQGIKIVIRDTGEGIAPENRESIFRPLFTTKKRGIGFGLAICKMIVEKHRGNIKVESEPGRGTGITLTLPLTDNSEGE